MTITSLITLSTDRNILQITSSTKTYVNHNNPRKLPVIPKTLPTTVSSIHPIKHATLYNKTVNNFRILRLLKTKVIHIDEIYVIPTRFGLRAKILNLAKLDTCLVNKRPA